MYSIGILSTVLFVLIATTSAQQCRPVTCMIACPYGFALDANGCPHCSCRTTPNVCREPIFGYNCGSIDHRACPASHECQFSIGGFSGQCCLKSSSSTTSRPTTSTARATTNSHSTSSRRPLSRLLVISGGSTTAQSASTTAQPASTTARATTNAHSSSTSRRFNRRFADQTSTTPRPSTTGQVTTSRGTTAGQVTTPRGTTAGQSTTSSSRVHF